MRTTWKPLSNETKRDGSLELSRFFLAETKVIQMGEKIQDSNWGEEDPNFLSRISKRWRS